MTSLKLEKEKGIQKYVYTRSGREAECWGAVVLSSDCASESWGIVKTMKDAQIPPERFRFL